LPQHPNNRPRQSATVASAIGHKGPPILATGKLGEIAHTYEVSRLTISWWTN
jgi:hypothetical protein